MYKKSILAKILKSYGYIFLYILFFYLYIFILFQPETPLFVNDLPLAV